VNLVVPYIGSLRAEDSRLIRLAEFLGITCETVALEKPAGSYEGYLQRAVPDRQSCLVVNPGVMKEWAGEGLPPERFSFLPAHSSRLLVHAAHPEPFHSGLVAALSGGCLRAVQGIPPASLSYDIPPECRDVCEGFAGLSFGPASPANDRVLIGDHRSPARRLIAIGGNVFMAAVRMGNSEVLFVGSRDVADLDQEAGDGWLVEHFSRFLPHAMALRHVFGERCWRPVEQHASVIVDDPLLRLNYGFLNFESLLQLMKQHNFQTTVAFIPYNFRRSSPRIARMFRENANRFALCFHGNDHTGAEFAANDPVLLNTMIEVAERRMKVHNAATGLACERVMVFPQGNFSLEAMAALKARNFEAAVNTVTHPRQKPVRLRIGEVAQPAVMRYAGFPLFLRGNSLNTQSPDIAFNLFFGRPVLIVEHHNIFKDPQSLIDAVTRINAVAPRIRWSSAGTAARNSVLRRREPDGTYRIRAYSRTVRLMNDAASRERFLIEWDQPGEAESVEKVLRNGRPCDRSGDQAGISVSADLDPGSADSFSLVYRSTGLAGARFGVRHAVRAFLRRRLSEVRDNYLSKNPRLLGAARTLQQRFQR
jgi:hypothetical protein